MPSAQALLDAWIAADEKERRRIEVAIMVTLHRSVEDLKRQLRRERSRSHELHEDDELEEE